MMDQRIPFETPETPETPETTSDIHTLQQNLLAWFARTARDLPWRQTRDPYRILVAEMMLQQTQVDRVIAHYHAFLRTFPTLEALAAAPVASVIKAWAGLGYNRRAVNLQRTAALVLQEHGGNFPQSVAALKQLPGIGAYTAGAIACFAFEQDIAFLDTNIRRVVQRCMVGAEESTATSDRELLRLAEALIPPGQGWHWNQAIMELGALLCTSSAPACWRCPLREQCRAYAAWKQHDEHAFASTAHPGDPAAMRYTPAPRRARRVAERPAEPFIGSNRYYRGRLVALLRALPADTMLPLAEAGPQIKPDYDAADDAAWLHTLVDGLVRDGLVEQVHDHIRLPTT